MNNPGQETMIAVGGRSLRDPSRSAEEVLSEVLEAYYRPRTAEALEGLRRVFQVAEDAYFGQWSAERFKSGWGVPLPGEFKLDQRLFGNSPGPATYLKEPCLDASGRQTYRSGLKSVLLELWKLAGSCDDAGRLVRIRRSVVVTLNLLNTVCYCLGEALD